MKNLSNTEAELNKRNAYKKERICQKKELKKR